MDLGDTIFESMSRGGHGSFTTNPSRSAPEVGKRDDAWDPTRGKKETAFLGAALKALGLWDVHPKNEFII